MQIGKGLGKYSIKNILRDVRTRKDSDQPARARNLSRGFLFRIYSQNKTHTQKGKMTRFYSVWEFAFADLAPRL